MSTIQELPFRLENSYGAPIDGDVRYVEGDEPKPAVVMCHGFKGFKDWGTFPAWGRRLAEAGFVAILFNFSYNGVHIDRPTEFTEFDKFANNTFSRELDDVEHVLSAATSGRLPGAPIDPGRIGLMGHSRGGGIAVLTAARNERVRALCTWSSVAGLLDRFTDEQKQEWEQRGYTEVLNTRTGQVLRLNRVLYEDAVEHKERLNVLRAAQMLHKPWLIIHAEDDEAVPYEEAKWLHDAAPQSELFTAMNGHTFGGAHPAPDPLPLTLQIVFNRTVNFFQKVL
ncbi:MAG: alpha/beta fold hydrolase [Bacteroidetes bacterium]|jgi:dienelactone hydrolase|nr:alpha/beta fold hydrolase [Bacteroidota bacterium]